MLWLYEILFQVSLLGFSALSASVLASGLHPVIWPHQWLAGLYLLLKDVIPLTAYYCFFPEKRGIYPPLFIGATQIILYTFLILAVRGFLLQALTILTHLGN